MFGRGPVARLRLYLRCAVSWEGVARMVSVKRKTHVEEYDVSVRRVGYHHWIVKV